MLGCSHLADDAIQEAQVALWKLPEPPPNPGAWLNRAIVHRCKHLRRTARRRDHHEHIASHHCELHKGCDNPLHVAIAHETGELLTQVLDTLPAEQRTPLELFEQKDLGYQGIADRLQLPIGTVRSRLSRARATVTAAMRRHAHPE